MAKKGNTKKTLKSLFSKSEANLTDSTVAELGSSGSVDKKGSSDKKKFKLPGLKIKSKSSSASEKAEQLQSAEKPGVSSEALADNVSMETDRSTMYATAPRSKAKELSGSDADLSSKPKRFATIHLGMRKKKKKEESVLSSSTFRIDSAGIEGQQTPSDISQMPLEQSKRKSLSRSQPELDTSEIFDIPSPPPVAVYKPEFPTETSVTVHSEPSNPQPVLNVTDDAPRAPIATIPELKLGGDFQPSAKGTTENISSNKEVATASSKVEKALSDFTKPKFDSGNNASVDAGNIQTPKTQLETPIRQPTQPANPLEIRTGENDLKITTTLEDQPKIDTATALNPKPNMTNSNLALDPKMAAINLSNQAEPAPAVGKTPSGSKSDEFDGKINDTLLISNNAKSTVDPVAPSLQVSGNYDSVPKTTTISSQSKMAEQDEPKIGVTLEGTQPNISNAFIPDPKMAAVDLGKQVQSSISTISNVDNASKPANLDTKVTETTTTYSSESYSTNSITPSLPLSSQSKMADKFEPKTGVTIDDTHSNISNTLTTDPKMAAVGLAKQVQSFTTISTISNVDNASKPANLDTKVTETTTSYSSESSSANSITPSLPLSSQSNKADKFEPKTGVTIDDTHSNISNTLTTDPKMTAVDLPKQVQSSTTISTISKPTNLDTKATESTTIYSSEKSSVNSITPSLNVSKTDRDISKTSPFLSRSKMAGQDDEKMYGVLYNSLFPQNFTQEVVSSLLNSPTKSTSEYKSLETVLVTQFDSEKVNAPLSTSSPEKIEEHLSKFSTVSADISSYAEEKSPKDSPKTVYIRKVTTYDTTSSNDTKPVVEVGRFAYSEFSTEPRNDIAHIRDTMEPAQSPPLLSYAPSQETNSAQISSESKRKVVLVKERVSDEATTSTTSSSSSNSRDSGCPTPIMERMPTSPSSEMKMEEFDMFSVTSGQTDLHEGVCSPAYLSVGSDEGSAIEVYFSAEEDNADDPFTGDATVIHVNATKDDAGVLEDLATNRTLVLMREDTNVSVNSAEKVFQRPIKQDQSENGMQEVMKAWNESKVEAPAAPVERVKEFQAVPPFAESTIGRKEGQGISQIELKDTPLVENNAKNELGANTGASKSIQERSSVGDNTWQITPKFAEKAEERVLSAEVKESVPERVISSAGGDNRAVDTITGKAGRGAVEQVANTAAAEAREAQTILQVTEERRTEPGLNQDQDQGPGQEQPELRQGSLPSSQTTPDPNLPHSDGMSSSYSSLSTTKLSLRTPAPPQPDDPASSRFRKVSLVSDSNGAAQGSDEQRWRNRLEGLQQFRPLADDDNTPTHAFSSSYASSDDRLDSTDGTWGGSGRGLAEKGAGPGQAPAELERAGVRSHAEAEEEEDCGAFSGVFKATLVDLVPESPTAHHPGAFVSPPGTPDDADMDNLVDTLKSMGPSMRLRSIGVRGAQPSLLTSSSLPPIVEDAPGSMLAGKNVNNNNKTEVDGLNGNIYVLPPDIGLKKTSFRDMRSPLEILKQEQQSNARPLQLRASATNSIVMRSSADSASSPEDLSSPTLPNGSTGSRLDKSLIFSSLRSSSVDQASENGLKTHRTIFRASSLPDVGHSNDRISLPPSLENGDSDSSAASRFERFSFLMNSSSSQSGGSLTGGDEYGGRISRAPQLSLGSPPSANSPTLMLSPTGSLERPFADSPIRLGGPSLLQRSFSGDSGVSLQQGALFNNNNMQNFQNHFQPQEPEPERNLLSKYRAFPDAYLTKEKEHGKLNPRPGKMYIFDRPGMCGQRTEIRSDVTDATSWELEETISIRVVRGGWVLYEKPEFKGEKIALDEGDIELTNPFAPLEEELQNGQLNGQMNGQTHATPTNGVQAQTNGDQDGETTEERPARRFIIGSIRRAVRDYSVPEISLFPEQNAEGKKVVFRDSSEDARIFGFPIKGNSIVINAGLWLVYGQPFFQGVPRVLEVGGYTNPEAWGVQKDEQPYVSSLHPLKIGEPRVENMAEPKMVVFEKPYFCGKSRTISSSSRDFMTRMDNRQQAFMHNVGSLKVMGGM